MLTTPNAALGATVLRREQIFGTQTLVFGKIPNIRARDCYDIDKMRLCVIIWKSKTQ